MLLKECLAELTEQEVLEYAKSFELEKSSNIHKAELIDQIVEHFCAEEMLRVRLSCLTNEQMKLFRNACMKPQSITIDEIVDGIHLQRNWFGMIEKSTGKFQVFEEVSKIFQKIEDESFKKDQYRKGWMVKCIQFFVTYFKIAPLEIIYEMYNLKVDCTIEEMIDLLWGMPVDIIGSCIFKLENLGMINWPKENPLYSERGLLVHLSMIEGDEINNLLREQMEKHFYIPTMQELEELYKFGYEASAKEYKELEAFFINKISFSREQAISWCLHVWENSYKGESPTQVLAKMSELQMKIANETDVTEFVELLINAYNSTRMKENRGHKPSDY